MSSCVEVAEAHACRAIPARRRRPDAGAGRRLRRSVPSFPPPRDESPGRAAARLPARASATDRQQRRLQRRHWPPPARRGGGFRDCSAERRPVELGEPAARFVHQKVGSRKVPVVGARAGESGVDAGPPRPARSGRRARERAARASAPSCRDRLASSASRAGRRGARRQGPTRLDTASRVSPHPGALAPRRP